MWLTFFHIMETLVIILDSSMVEHSAVNRVVVGSSPTRGAINPVNIAFTGFFGITETILFHFHNMQAETYGENHEC